MLHNVMYYYQDITLTNVKAYNTVFYGGSGNTPTVNSSEFWNCGFTQAITQGTGTIILANTTDGISAGYSMPTDPSSTP